MAKRTLLGAKIMEVRKSMNMTQAQLAEEVGVTGGAISQFEKGTTKPTLVMLQKLTDVLGIDLVLMTSDSKSYVRQEDLHPRSLGAKIEEARKKMKLSQAALADLVGVSRASISLYETGGGKPSLKVLESLADALGLPYDLLAMLGDSPDYDGYSKAAILTQKLEHDNILRSHEISMHFGVEEEYIEIDFFPPPGLLIDPNNLRFLTSRPDEEVDTGVRWPTLSVLKVPGVDYSEARIITVRGNRMAPRYPDKSRHVIHPMHDASQRMNATGVHAFMLEDRNIMIRYISSNIKGKAILKDALGYETGIDLTSDISVWRVGQAVHMPAEE
jgi:transcriptional regulator with XRE-family HTH domain